MDKVFNLEERITIWNNEIKAERIEECVKQPYLIGDLIDDIELLKEEVQKKEYQISCFQKDLKILNDRLKENK